MRRHRWLTVLALAAAVALVGAACSKKASSGGGKITINGTQASDHGSKDISGGSSVQVQLNNSGSDYYFSPTVIIGTAGQQVSVDLSNAGNTPHTFTIDSANVDQELQPGAQATVSVTLPSSGTLVFSCRFHQSLGMLGQFSVGA